MNVLIMGLYRWVSDFCFHGFLFDPINHFADKPTIKNWDWPLTAITGLEASPVYDGSETSMFGNGEYILN